MLIVNNMVHWAHFMENNEKFIMGIGCKFKILKFLIDLINNYTLQTNSFCSKYETMILNITVFYIFYPEI
jgi:hypothetical protein